MLPRERHLRWALVGTASALAILAAGVVAVGRRRHRRRSGTQSSRSGGKYKKENEENDIEQNDIEDSVTIADDEQRLKHAPSLSNGNAGKRNRAAVEEYRPQKHVPGSQRVFVRTYGCSHNTSDAEFMSGQLESYGYVLVDDIDNADVALLNSCTVKNPSQDAAVNLAARAKANGIPVVMSGCVPQADRKLKGLEDVSLLGITQIDRVVEVVEQALAGNVVRLLKRKALPTLDLPKIRKNPQVEIVPLSTGCLGRCSYCKTRDARGKLGSYAPTEIRARVRRACEEGVQQIWLTSEDTGAYGLDLGGGCNIATLLQGVAAELEAFPNCMMRLGMTNPPYMLEHIEAVAEVLKHPQVFEFIHVPVQSGSNRVLDAMVREYTVQDFDALVNGLRERVPSMTVCTDIICGFPGETEADHRESVDLVKRHRFPVLNISQFYPRPGTPAANMRKLPSDLVKKRSSEMHALFESYVDKSYTNLKGEECRVWFSEHSDRSPHTVGHTKQHVKVLVPRDACLIGSSKMCRILSCHAWHVSAEVIG